MRICFRGARMVRTSYHHATFGRGARISRDARGRKRSVFFVCFHRQYCAQCIAPALGLLTGRFCGFSAPQGRHVAPIGVKFGVDEVHSLFPPFPFFSFPSIPLFPFQQSSGKDICMLPVMQYLGFLVYMGVC